MKLKPSKPSKKDFQRQIGEMGNGLNFLFQELGRLKGNLGGLENIMSKAKLGNFVTSYGDQAPIFEKNILGKALTSPGGIIAATSLLPL